MTEGECVGVDWSSGAWVAVAYAGGDTPEVEVFEDIETLWDDYGGRAESIVVDVPIGLCKSHHAEVCRCEKDEDGLSRLCDDLARTVLGSRSSSVFTAPCREAARMAADPESQYADVNEKNRKLTDKGLMRQAANISEGIVDVESVRCSPALIVSRVGDEGINLPDAEVAVLASTMGSSQAQTGQPADQTMRPMGDSLVYILLRKGSGEEDWGRESTQDLAEKGIDISWTEWDRI